MSQEFITITWILHLERLRKMYCDYRQRILLKSYDFVQLTWVTDLAYSVVFLYESLQMDSRYWVRHEIHRLGIWINVNVYLFMWITLRVSSNIFLFSCSTQGKSDFWCAFRWRSSFMTSTTSVFSYFASKISVAKLLSQSSPKSLSLTWMWNMSFMASNSFEFQTSRWTKWDGVIKPPHVSTGEINCFYEYIILY